MTALLADGADGGKGLLHGLAAFTFADWMLALAAAVLAAVLLEVVALVRRAVTKRLPFLLLRCTVIMVPFKDWKFLYHEVWEPDLHDLLTTKSDEPHPGENIRRYARALAFSFGLVAGGAIRTQRQRSTAHSRQSHPLFQMALYEVINTLASVGLVLLSADQLWLTVVLAASTSVQCWIVWTYIRRMRARRSQ
ncbi:hypothetical protein QMK19_25230 [Streptomyces sp. H10-C2]|uniref:hypothetical protein n=1 Tax=unclassified Streptomyces TaxID=2593676 RepID=UPI0024B9A5AA|nr:MULTISPECIES: hypothetical protein [unclassified Streptomyces]MDJ0343346.1 hypothetical protein [Streptomyces sp. PH10-H1]MDJ0372869.1 hypothetical protein [Streptomyces sp. H10-C2]